MSERRRVRYRGLVTEFATCHRRRLNVELHLVATPLGVVGLLSLADALHDALGPGLALAYLGALWPQLPAATRARTTLALALLVIAAQYLALGALASGAVIAVAWLIQDLAHRVTHERAYAASYAGARDAASRWMEHTALLLPMVLDLAARDPLPFLSRLVPARTVTCERLGGSSAEDLRTVRAGLEPMVRATETTTHVWRHDLDSQTRDALDRVAGDAALLDLARAAHDPSWIVERIPRMDEVYVTGPEKKLTSDTVFFMPHVDGPWSVFPGAAVYRTMVGVTPNRRIRTHFPMEGDVGFTLDKGEAVAFDFNRQLHFITCDVGQPQPSPRINLKLHYVAYAPGLRAWGRLLAWLTTIYDERARALFLATLAPTTLGQRLGAAYVVASTRLFALFTAHVGARNVVVAGALASASLALGTPIPWLVGIGFVHYAIYVATLHAGLHGRRVAFGTFVRDAVFFKTLSMGSLAVCYVAVWRGADAVSLGVTTAGFALAGLAARRIGWQRTYFAEELGLLPPIRIRAFPYGVVPHPMILGALVGLIGIALYAPFRAAWPWLVPVHVALYGVVLAQEIVSRDSFVTRMASRAGG